MHDAIIIIIGNEILSGRTLDKNANFISCRCSKIGISVDEIRIIPDKVKIIKKTVIEASKKYKNVFVTGGIGPTHDDITALSVSLAFKKKLVINKKAKKLLEDYYKSSKLELNESRMKMAYLPAQSKLIMNSVSAAPGFKIKNVWVMAGVPKIMQAMFLDSVEPRLKKGKIFFSKTLKVNKPEGDIAHILNNIYKEFVSINIGSYPFYNPPEIGTNIVLRGKDLKLIEKAIKKISNIFKKINIPFSID
tara:strand:+ start:47 stop:790 length:744 start_codon:yes stop_codon:yes gene_type:complete